MNTTIFSNLNWLHILVAAIAYFALVSVWYSALFGKRWVAYQRIDVNAPDAKKGVAAIMFGSFVWMFVTSVGLAIIVSRLNLTTALSGVKWGLLTGICFSAAAISISYLYVKKPTGLHFIDSLYHIIGQIIAAVILSAWH
ncbi:MAG TPA: DUF1761 domain-containing protein [Flavisolibacter sp.]|nr:DUF1761 domain-containing protein [Flavisolibacter sp.]